MINFTKKGKYGCFSNFYPTRVEYQGIIFTSSEAAWQSLKTHDIEVRKKFALYTATEAKKKGRRLDLRSDWEEVKYQLMVDILLCKFSQNEDIKGILLSTGDEYLIENTTGWHDNEWGNCKCGRCIGIEGRNLLGKALMKVRAVLRESEIETR